MEWKNVSTLSLPSEQVWLEYHWFSVVCHIHRIANHCTEPMCPSWNAEERKNPSQTLGPDEKEEERKKNKKAVRDWIEHLERETSKAFLPA